ncbi:MAG: YraN family protein [Planctomycetota bacterium]
MKEVIRRVRRWALPYALQRRGGGRVAVGNRGEALAAKHFKRAGWRVIGRNVVVGGGEVDLVAEGRDGTIAVVEVKTVSRRAGQDADAEWSPERQVNGKKRDQLRKLAAALCALKAWPKSRVRFDVVAVELFGDGTHELRHHAGAFGWRGSRR